MTNTSQTPFDLVRACRVFAKSEATMAARLVEATHAANAACAEAARLEASITNQGERDAARMARLDADEAFQVCDDITDSLELYARLAASADERLAQA